MSVKNYYQSCFVPFCRNTSIKTPTKLFIHVPEKIKMRKKWLELAGVNMEDVSPKSNLFFCEDHFDLPNDMLNYMEYHIIGSVKKILTKPTCLPSKFDCQFTSKRLHTTALDDYQQKRQRKELVDQLLLQYERKKTEEQAAIPSTSKEIQSDKPKFAHKAIQVRIFKKYRSKGSQTHVRLRDSATSPIIFDIANINVTPLKKMSPSKSGATREFVFIKEETLANGYYEECENVFL